MNNAANIVATRIQGRRSTVALAGLAVGLTLMAFTAFVGATPVLAGFGGEAPVSVTVTGGDVGQSAGLAPGDRVTLTPLVIGASGGDMRYALHAVVHGSDQLIRQMHATARTADGVLLYDGPLARLSIGGGATGYPERLLAGGSVEQLSVSIALSFDAGNEIQGASLAIIWRADAIAAAGTTLFPGGQA